MADPGVIEQTPSFNVTSFLKKSLDKLLSVIGFDMLSAKETHSFLAPVLLSSTPDHPVLLPDLPNQAVPGEILFQQRSLDNEPVYTWALDRPGKKNILSAYGSVVNGDKILCLDYGHSGYFKGLLRLNKRSTREVKTVIAPWSQYQDGISFGGYYDFVILIAAKICRIRQAIDPAEFSGALVSYPLFDTSYEREYLELLGIRPEQVVDSRNVKVVAQRAFIGNSGHWFYPNQADLLSLKQTIESQVAVEQTDKKRIYISRSGRRRISNEEELITMLSKFGFTVIEDTGRSLAEQVNIYRNAAVIIGPHGASFTNIIWCKPGTHLVELFSSNYRTDFFQYISQVVGMTYSAYCYGTAGTNKVVSDTLGEDVLVSIPELERHLTDLLG